MKCRHCGAMVDEKYSFCPNCGKKFKKSAFWKIIFTMLGLILLLSFCTDKPDKTSVNSGNNKTSVSTTEPTAKSESDINTSANLQNFREYEATDKISGQVAKYIEIDSDNEIDFDFPYQGAQHATLTLRKHPRLGNDIMISIEKGQILCDTFDGCNIAIRFSDSKNEKYSAAGPSDNSSTIIFIKNYKRFIKHLKQSETVYVELPFFQEGARTLEFTISDDLKKYLKESW